MGKDWPDWGQSYTNAAFYPLLDHGELAARLGSPILWDRRGSLVWWNDFLYGTSEMSTGGVDSAADLDLIVSGNRLSPFGARLRGTASATSQVWMYKEFSLPNTTRIGWTTLARCGDPFEDVGFGMWLFSGGHRWQYQLRLPALSADEVILYTSGGQETIALADTVAGSSSHYIPLKMVIDLDTLKYERIIVANQEFDVSAYSPVDYDTVGGLFVWPYVTAWGDDTHQPDVYVDSIILTANEPSNT